MPGQNLRTPGPTPLPPAVREALGRDMVNHRGPEFAAVLRACIDGLKWAYQTQYDVLILTASGTGGLESAIVNTLSPGDQLLAVSIGYFGDRLIQLARAFGVEVVELRFPAGQAADPQRLVDCLRSQPRVQSVFITHNETSTGVLNPLPQLVAAVRQVRPEALVQVDGISSVGSVPMRPEAWGCDVVVAGSQKGWMAPPGLAFVAISPRGWEHQARARLPRTYFDWAAHRRFVERGSTPWTPAVSACYALQAGLELMQAEGLEQIFERHQQLARYTREALADLDLRLLADPAHASPTVTTAWIPEGIDGGRLLRSVRERHAVVLAGGQGELDGRIVRIGHLGWVRQDDLAAAVRALQVELNSARVAAVSQTA